MVCSDRTKLLKLSSKGSIRMGWGRGSLPVVIVSIKSQVKKSALNCVHWSIRMADRNKEICFNKELLESTLLLKASEIFISSIKVMFWRGMINTKFYRLVDIIYQLS